MEVRRILAIVVFALIAIAAIDTSWLRVLFVDRETTREAMVRYADGAWWPAYPAFLATVRDATRPGDTIAIVVPARQWDRGYSYAFYRASYVLAGREVVPVVGRDNSLLPANLSRAKYAAVWRTSHPRDAKIVARAHGGVLVVR